MAIGQIPPWLNVQPAFFTQALEAGARAGIAVAEQNQRAAALAEARAERQAQMAQRAEEQAERQRQFEASRLLDVQRLAQNAAELAQLGDYRQQQARHQAAQEANAAAQESRLLDFQKGQLAYDQGRLDVDKRRAALAEKEAAEQPTWIAPVPGGAPGYFRLPGGGVSVPSTAITDESRQRVGSELTTPSGLHAIWVGPNQIRLVDNGVSKDFTGPQLLAYAKAIQYSPNPTNREKSEAILNFIGTKVEQQMTPGTNALTVLTKADLERPVAVRGQGTREDPARPETQRQMDSIPSKSYYIDPGDGKLYRKK